MNHVCDSNAGFVDGAGENHPQPSPLPWRDRESNCEPSNRFSHALQMVLRPLAWMILAAIAFYQFALRPLLPSSCIYTPGCSAYFTEAVRRHGPIRGSALGIKRLCRCHPWGRGGIDPVP